MKRFKALLLSAAVVLCSPWALGADEPRPITANEFAKLHQTIKPKAGEIKFWEIPWLLTISEARQKAAAEGKPILIWSGAGGAPIGLC